RMQRSFGRRSLATLPVARIGIGEERPADAPGALPRIRRASRALSSMAANSPGPRSQRIGGGDRSFERSDLQLRRAIGWQKADLYCRAKAWPSYCTGECDLDDEGRQANHQRARRRLE